MYPGRGEGVQALITPMEGVRGHLTGSGGRIPPLSAGGECDPSAVVRAQKKGDAGCENDGG
jgi:hypothetical protein